MSKLNRKWVGVDDKTKSLGSFLFLLKDLGIIGGWTITRNPAKLIGFVLKGEIYGEHDL